MEITTASPRPVIKQYLLEPLVPRTTENKLHIYKLAPLNTFKRYIGIIGNVTPPANSVLFMTLENRAEIKLFSSQRRGVVENVLHTEMDEAQFKRQFTLN